MYWLQDQCGASYAFSAIGALEGAWSLAHGEQIELSEQNIIDCSGILWLHLHTNHAYVHGYLSSLQYHMEIMAVMEAICTTPSSTLYLMMVWTWLITIPSRER